MSRNKKFFIVSVGIAAVVLFLIISLGFISNGAKPGDFLYGVDRGYENFSLNMSKFSGDRAFLYKHLELADERVAELNDLNKEVNKTSAETNGGIESIINTVSAQQNSGQSDDLSKYLPELLEDYNYNIDYVEALLAELGGNNTDVNDFADVVDHVSTKTDELEGELQNLLEDEKIKHEAEYLLGDSLENTSEVEETSVDLLSDSDKKSETINNTIRQRVAKRIVQVNEKLVKTKAKAAETNMSGEQKVEVEGLLQLAGANLKSADELFAAGEYSESYSHLKEAISLIETVKDVIDDVEDKEDTDVNEQEEEENDKSEAQYKINSAKKAISDTQTKISEKAADIDEAVKADSNELLQSAQGYVNQAVEAFNNGNYSQAKEYAEKARDLAKRAKRLILTGRKESDETQKKAEEHIKEAQSEIKEADKKLKQLKAKGVNTTEESGKLQSIQSLLAQAKEMIATNPYGSTLKAREVERAAKLLQKRIELKIEQKKKSDSKSGLSETGSDDKNDDEQDDKGNDEDKGGKDSNSGSGKDDNGGEDDSEDDKDDDEQEDEDDDDDNEDEESYIPGNSYAVLGAQTQADDAKTVDVENNNASTLEQLTFVFSAGSFAILLGAVLAKVKKMRGL